MNSTSWIVLGVILIALAFALAGRRPEAEENKIPEKKRNQRPEYSEATIQKLVEPDGKEPVRVYRRLKNLGKEEQES